MVDRVDYLESLGLSARETVYKVVAILEDGSVVSVLAGKGWRRTYESKSGRRYWVEGAFAFRSKGCALAFMRSLADADDRYDSCSGKIAKYQIVKAEAEGVGPCRNVLNVWEGLSRKIPSPLIKRWVRDTLKKTFPDFLAGLCNVGYVPNCPFDNVLVYSAPYGSVICKRLRLIKDGGLQ